MWCGASLSLTLMVKGRLSSSVPRSVQFLDSLSVSRCSLENWQTVWCASLSLTSMAIGRLSSSVPCCSVSRHVAYSNVWKIEERGWTNVNVSALNPFIHYVTVVDAVALRLPNLMAQTTGRKQNLGFIVNSAKDSHLVDAMQHSPPISALFPQHPRSLRPTSSSAWSFGKVNFVLFTFSRRESNTKD